MKMLRTAWVGSNFTGPYKKMSAHDKKVDFYPMVSFRSTRKINRYLVRRNLHPSKTIGPSFKYKFNKCHLVAMAELANKN